MRNQVIYLTMFWVLFTGVVNNLHLAFSFMFLSIDIITVASIIVLFMLFRRKVVGGGIFAGWIVLSIPVFTQVMVNSILSYYVYMAFYAAMVLIVLYKCLRFIKK